MNICNHRIDIIIIIIFHHRPTQPSCWNSIIVTSISLSLSRYIHKYIEHTHTLTLSLSQSVSFGPTYYIYPQIPPYSIDATVTMIQFQFQFATLWMIGWYGLGVLHLVCHPPLCSALITGGMQSADNGATYAGGLTYDASQGVVYVTGSTYGTFSGTTATSTTTTTSLSNCFLGVIQLPSTPNEAITWIDRHVYGTTSVSDACSAIVLSTVQSHRQALMIGGTQPGGLLTNLASTSSTSSTTNTNTPVVQQYGMVLDVNFHDAGMASLVGGTLLQDTIVQYPMAIIADPQQSYVYVASMESSDGSINTQYATTVSNNEGIPNFTSGGLKQYGNLFDMKLQRIRVDGPPNPPSTTLQSTMTSTWKRTFSVVGGNHSVYVAGMVQVSSELLVVVGSTKGAGEAFGGESSRSSSSSSSSSATSTMDGFLTKINPNTGEYMAQGSNARVSGRFGSSTNDDWITQVCDAMDGGTHIYIVGATTGSLHPGQPQPPPGNVDAFVAKINTVTLQTVWVQQFTATPPTTGGTNAIAYALDCIVTSDAALVYVTGVVEGGAVMDDPSSTDPQHAHGGDDIFALQVTADTGRFKWLKQMGTSGDDHVAHGKGLIVDKYGNAIIYGDTTGSFFRLTIGDPNPQTSDIFLLYVSKLNGAYQTPAETSGVQNTGGTPHYSSVDIRNGAGDPTDGSTTGNTSTTSTPGTGGSNNNDNNNNHRGRSPTTSSSSNSNSNQWDFLGWIGLGLALAIALFLLATRVKRERQRMTDRAMVCSYLRGFDVEDIDLRHSVTGGWHGTYVNKLARGVNTYRPNFAADLQQLTLETAPLTSSSTIVKDSLFMDVESTPSLGFTDLDADHRLEEFDDDDDDIDDDDHHSFSSGSGSGLGSRGYGRLIGAYNDLDLRPRSSRSSSNSSADRRSRFDATNNPWGREII